MFDNLQEKLQGTFRKMSGKGVLTDENVSAAVREVKVALLEADVNYRVVSVFLKKLKSRALGSEVQNALNPSQQFIKIVRDELISMMGDENHQLTQNPNGLTTIMIVGLQGGGKTTTAAKLAARIKTWGKKTYLIPADVYRPAAIDQLKTLAKRVNVDCFDSNTGMDPVDIAKRGVQAAKEAGANFAIIDTAGRLQIDHALMQELQNIKKAVPIDEILFIADAMTGQEAVNIAKAFHEILEFSGFVLTKMDGDARGGAALSIRAITGKPVKFIGTGENINQLDPFYPDRIVSKMLGMGDVLSLIEKADQEFSTQEAKDLEAKLLKGQLTLEDFQLQLQKIQKMGPIKELVKMLPGMGQVPEHMNADDSMLTKTNAIISSMTQEEKRNHTLLNASRKVRIAKGSGTQVSDINRMLKQFQQMRSMAQKMSGMGKKGKMPSLDQLKQSMGKRGGKGSGRARRLF